MPTQVMVDRTAVRDGPSDHVTTAHSLDAWIVGGIAFLLLLAWWAAYFPGLMTVDTFQAWNQIRAGVYQDWHPVIHTWVMGLLLRVWDSPGIVSLAQVIGLAAVLGTTSRQLEFVGVRRWMRIGLPLFLAAIPPVGKMVVTIWKDVPFGISVLWLYVEVIGVVGTWPTGFGRRRAVRLGLALLNVFLWRLNGLAVGAAVLVFLFIAFRDRWRQMLIVAFVGVGGLLLIRGPLYAALDAWPTPALQSHSTLIHDMGAIITHHRAELDADDRAFLETILPLERWGSGPNGLYDCRQATGLIFPPEMFPRERYNPDGVLVPVTELDPVLSQNPDSNVLATDSARFRSIWRESVLGWPMTVLRHRLCVGASAWSPVSVFGEAPLIPASRMGDNNLGFETTPLHPGLKTVLDGYNSFWGGIGVVSWRPAWVVYLGFVSWAFGWWRTRRRLARFWPVILTAFFSWAAVVVITPGQSFRYVWPAYLCGWVAVSFFALRRE